MLHEDGLIYGRNASEPCYSYVHAVDFMNMFVCLTLCTVCTVLKSLYATDWTNGQTQIKCFEKLKERNAALYSTSSPVGIATNLRVGIGEKLCLIPGRCKRVFSS